MLHSHLVGAARDGEDRGIEEIAAEFLHLERRRGNDEPKVFPSGKEVLWWVGGWVGGWVVEEEKAVGMSYCGGDRGRGGGWNELLYVHSFVHLTHPPTHLPTFRSPKRTSVWMVRSCASSNITTE